MDRVKLNGGRYSLYRERDGAGDSGMMLEAIDPDTGEVVSHGEIIIGHSIKCGSPLARTFGSDWWITTPVTEILEVNEEKTEARVKTGNSIYKVKAF